MSTYEHNIWPIFFFFTIISLKLVHNLLTLGEMQERLIRVTRNLAIDIVAWVKRINIHNISRFDLSLCTWRTDAECHPPPAPAHSLMAQKLDGAILMFFCEPGYTLIGNAEIYCDGVQWNGTIPYCRGIAVILIILRFPCLNYFFLTQ